MLTMEHSKEGLHFLSHELASKTDEFSEIVESEQGAHITCTYMYCLFSVVYSFQLENKKTQIVCSCTCTGRDMHIYVNIYEFVGRCVHIYVNIYELVGKQGGLLSRLVMRLVKHSQLLQDSQALHAITRCLGILGPVDLMVLALPSSLPETRGNFGHLVRVIQQLDRYLIDQE